MKIGVKFFGEIDSLGPESIQTKFFLLGLPLIPLESYYCLEQTSNGIKGFPIPLSSKSILLTYLRWWVVALSIVVGIIQAFIIGDRSWAILIVLGILIGWLSMKLGRLHPDEKRRRMVFRTIVGLGAPPELLPDNVSQNIRIGLEKQWLELQSSSTVQDWQTILSPESIKLERLPLLYCLASYGNKPLLASNVWQTMELNWDKIFKNTKQEQS